MNQPQIQNARPQQSIHLQYQRPMHPQMKDARPRLAPSSGLRVTVQDGSTSMLGGIYSMIHALAALFAIFLTFRCNQGFDLGSFIGAVLCPYIYIIYQFAQAKMLCGVLG
jgi:hypothetical protein